jgi:hypothetical protein
MRFTTLLLLLLIATPSFSAAPRIVNYQGFIMESPDGPPIEGNVDLIFSVHPDSTGGNALWTENRIQVPVTRGVFNVNLGEVQPFPAELFADGSRWLDIYVPNYASSLPRLRLTSVVWALHASVADTALSFYGDLPEHAHSLDSLADVDAPLPSTGEALTWSGNEWAPALPGAGYDEPRIAGHLEIPGGSITTSWTTFAAKEFTAPSDGFVMVYGQCSTQIIFGSGPDMSGKVVVVIRRDGEVLAESNHMDSGYNFVSNRILKLQDMIPVTEGANMFELAGYIPYGEDGNIFSFSNAEIWVMFFPISTSDVTIVE